MISVHSNILSVSISILFLNLLVDQCNIVEYYGDTNSHQLHQSWYHKPNLFPPYQRRLSFKATGSICDKCCTLLYSDLLKNDLTTAKWLHWKWLQRQNREKTRKCREKDRFRQFHFWTKRFLRSSFTAFDAELQMEFFEIICKFVGRLVLELWTKNVSGNRVDEISQEAP